MKNSTVCKIVAVFAFGTVIYLCSTQNCFYTTSSSPSTSSLSTKFQKDDVELLEAVRLALVRPADCNEPYNLNKPEQIRGSQYGQDELVEKIFKGKRNGFFFEAGALDGERFSNSLYFERQLGWTGVLVEPIPPSFEDLKKKNRKAYALNACLSPNTSATELFLGFQKSKALAQFTENSTSSNTYRVMCVPLFTILQALGNPTVDYLSLDIEGHELKILKTIPWDRVQIRLLGIEINHLPEGAKAVVTYMEEQGFMFYKLHKIDYFFYKPELASDMDLQFIDDVKWNT